MPRSTGWCACSTAAPTRSTSRRRIVRMAVEDVGLADPRALRLALDACETYERLGSPGGRARARRGGDLPGGGGEVERGLRRL